MKRGVKDNFFLLVSEKKGLSQLVITVLIISLAIVAIGIVWVIVSGIIESSKEDVDFGQNRINMNIRNVYIEDPLISINVNRLTGVGRMEGVRFVFSDGRNTEFFDGLISLEELQERTFEAELNELDPFLLQTVSIAPLIILPSGNVRIGNIVDTYRLTDKDFNSSSFGQDRCTIDEDCNPDVEEEGSDVCNSTTGNIETLWNFYTCLSGRCRESEGFRESQLCDYGCDIQNATCLGSPECFQASNCGTDGWSGLPYCDIITGDVYQAYTNYFCIGGFCQNGVTHWIVEDCDDFGCFEGDDGGECVPGPECNYDSDCGEDYLILGSEYCPIEVNEVWMRYRDNYCEDNVCKNNITYLPKDGGNCSAMEGEWSCEYGECIEYIECTNDDHCNPDGTCGRICVEEECVPEFYVNSGIVESIWPLDMGEYFDSGSLPKNETSYLDHFVRFTSGSEGRCLKVSEYVYPTPPGENSYIRFDVKTTFVLPGDSYEVWKTKRNCECTNPIF